MCSLLADICLCLVLGGTCAGGGAAEATGVGLCGRRSHVQVHGPRRLLLSPPLRGKRQGTLLRGRKVNSNIWLLCDAVTVLLPLSTILVPLFLLVVMFTRQFSGLGPFLSPALPPRVPIRLSFFEDTAHPAAVSCVASCVV